MASIESSVNEARIGGIRCLLACLFAFLPAHGVFAAGTAAGTIIENAAVVEFVRGGVNDSATSNTVTLIVSERLDVLVTPQPGQVPVPAGALNQVLLFTITNSGNASEVILLAMNSVVGGDDFDPSPVLPDSIYFDSDGSGDFNTGDIAYTPGVNDPLLAPDQFIDVFLLNDIPAGLANGDVGRSELTATAATGSGSPGDIFAGQGDGGTDAVVGTSGATATELSEYVVQDVEISVLKAQSVLDPNGGSEPVATATITYTIDVEVTNIGTATASYIADPIPTWATYVPGSITLNGAAISDATDGDAGEYDTSGVPTVVVRLGDLTLADGVQTLVFQVTID